MKVLELITRVVPAQDPVFTGEWATVVFRPDLGSQQEFIVGVAAAISGDEQPIFKWVPSMAKLSSLYGDALTSSDVYELIKGSELSMRAESNQKLSKLDTGTPHLRIVPCGYFASQNVDLELQTLLRRHAGVIWAEPSQRDAAMDDDWAYQIMRSSLASIQGSVFVPNRRLTFGNKNLEVGLDNGRSFGNIVSARYASLQTIERHISNSVRQVFRAHNITARAAAPALFIVLPDVATPENSILTRKTNELLQEVGEMGVLQFSDRKPEALAHQLEQWASV